MTLTVPLAGLLGLGTGLGLLLLVMGLLGRADTPVDPGKRSAVGRWIAERGPVDRRRLAACLTIGVLVAVLTHWPVAAVLAGVGMWVLPEVVGPDRGHAHRIARIEAIAVWTEALRDNLAGAAGLEQAITASGIEAPEPIRDEVTRLATRLRRHWRLPDALRGFAAELADPTADLVVAGLVMAARGAASQLGDVLSELATSARAKVASRQRVAAGRQRNRTSTLVIVGATLVMAVGMSVLNRGYLHPFNTPVGQLALLAVGGCFGFAFWWLIRLVRDKDTTRILAGIATPTPQPTGGEVVGR